MMGQKSCPKCGSNRTTIRVVLLFDGIDERLGCYAYWGYLNREGGRDA